MRLDPFLGAKECAFVKNATTLFYIETLWFFDVINAALHCQVNPGYIRANLP